MNNPGRGESGHSSPQSSSRSDIDKNNNSDTIPELPPPSPCKPPDDDHTFTPPIFVLPTPHQPRRDHLHRFHAEDFKNVPKLPQKGILRSESIGTKLDRCCTNSDTPIYENQWETDSQDDNMYPYYFRYYSNIGNVKVRHSKMRFRIERRSRLSDNMEEVDFAAVDAHEEYIETRFYTRALDSKYQK